MGDTRAVVLSVELPVQVADRVEEIQYCEPQVLSGALRYMLLRKRIFEVLAGSSRPSALTA